MKLFTSIDKSEGRCTASEVGQPWELRWGIEDMEKGDCDIMDVGTPRKIVDNEPETIGPHKLLEGLDPDHPDTDRTILRRIWLSDPVKFLDNYGPQINKMIDLAAKEERPERYPPLDDLQGWTKLAKDVAKAVSEGPGWKLGKCPYHTVVILIYLLVESDFSLTKMEEYIRSQAAEGPVWQRKP